MKKRFFLSLLFFFVLVGYISAQSIITSENEQKKSNESNLNLNSKKIIQSMNEDKGPVELAEDYYNMATELVKAGDLAKAETYILKAIDLGSQKKGNKKISAYYRELAKIQEARKKYEAAASNYQRASETSQDRDRKSVV